MCKKVFFGLHKYYSQNYKLDQLVKAEIQIDLRDE